MSALVCDLVHLALTQPARRIALSLSKEHLGRTNRYRPEVFTKTLPDILQRLASPEMSFVSFEKGRPGYFGAARQSTIGPGTRLLSRIEDYKLRLSDLGRAKGEEVIVLKRPKADFWDQGGWIDYEDTPQTRTFREEVRTINQWIEAADIISDPIPVDTTDRRLRRYFSNGAFDSGGRLFGGFWQPISKADRKASLLINEEETVTLDYSQMAPRILYGMAGIKAPETDAYLLPGLDHCRAGVKKLFSALLFTQGPLERFPRGTRELFPSGLAVAQVVEMLAQAHPSIAHLFHTGIGHAVQFRESEVLIDVLLALQDEKITALPVHDAVIIPSSAITKTRTIMEDVFLNHTGTPALINEEE